MIAGWIATWIGFVLAVCCTIFLGLIVAILDRIASALEAIKVK